MSLNKVTVIDYGVGNILSVRRGLEHNDASVLVTGDPEIILQADRLVLPGVGAFADGMKELEKRHFISLLSEVAEKGTPLLGICLGMQLLLDHSEEFGATDGLGLIPGTVTAISSEAKDGQRLKIPHIGWSNLVKPEHVGATWKQTLLNDVTEDSALYFVHSFMAQPKNSKHLIAGCLYGDNFIPAVIQSENIVGCQFHPEKSGRVGLQILKNFLTL
jgi:imidazole glycerol-phosphate synthase subunit HisH